MIRRARPRPMPLSQAAMLAGLGTFVSVYAIAWAIRVVLNVG